MTASAPIVSLNGTGYHFSWPPEAIEIYVTRLKTHSSDGRITGEVEITAGTGHLHGSEFNFTGPRARQDLSKILKVRQPKLDWLDMLEQLCYHVKERVRQGAPVVELWAHEGMKPPEFLIYPLIVKGYPNTIFGDPGAFKSNLAVALCHILLLPEWENPLGLRGPKEMIRLLYLDWETNDESLEYQIHLFRQGHGIEPFPIPYRYCATPLSEDIEAIRSHVYDQRAELIIIDSLGMAAGGDLNTTSVPMSFFAALRSLKTTSLILAHNSKDKEQKTRSIYGNQFFTAQARNIWEIRKSQEEGSNAAELALFHRKPPPFSKLQRPLGFHLRLNEQGILFSADKESVQSFPDQISHASHITNALRHGPLSVKDIAEETNIDETSVRVTLNRNKKRFVKNLDGRWGLLSLSVTP